MSDSPGSTTLRNIGGQDINPDEVIHRKQDDEEDEEPHGSFFIDKVSLTGMMIMVHTGEYHEQSK